MSPCRIAAADRRLRDAYEHWRRMERSYFDPYEFRLNLNSFVQDARNVSFILQKSKDRIPDFDSWYGRWQERMRGDAVMRWAVEARNRVTKQDDLEAGSRSVVTFTADWTDERTSSFRAKAFVPSVVLIEQARAKVSPEL